MIKRSAALCLLSLFSCPAQALTVFDPANYTQNVLTATNSLEQINNQIRSLQNEALMLQSMARNLQSLDYSSSAQISDTLSRINTLMTRASSLSYTVSTLNDEWRAHYPSTYSPSVSSQDLSLAAHQRWQSTMSAYQQTLQLQSEIVSTLPKDQRLIDDLSSRSQGAAGALQAQQATNEFLALSAQQNIQTHALLASHFRAQGQDAARKVQAEEAGRVTTKRFLGEATAYKTN